MHRQQTYRRGLAGAVAVDACWQSPRAAVAAVPARAVSAPPRVLPVAADPT